MFRRAAFGSFEARSTEVGAEVQRDAPNAT